MSPAAIHDLVGHAISLALVRIIQFTNA